MLDRTIPFYNMILRCDNYQHKDMVLPKGFSIVPYKSGYEKAWAELEYSIGDFESLEEAESYFISTYLQNGSMMNNILFLLNEDNKVSLFVRFIDIATGEYETRIINKNK